MSFHIGAKPGAIAGTVLLPGDPLRARYIAEQFLEEVTCYSQVRNMLGFTGLYKGKRISVQGTGMGIPSTAIYTTELIREYGADTLIRVGTCGSLHEHAQIGDVILAMSACTDSNVNRHKFGGLDYAPTASYELLSLADRKAQELSIPVRIGSVFSTDVFYNGSPERYRVWSDHGILGLEMESAILYTLAAGEKARALTILTVSDNLVTGAVMSAEDREKHIDNIAKIALETALG